MVSPVSSVITCQWEWRRKGGGRDEKNINKTPLEKLPQQLYLLKAPPWGCWLAAGRKRKWKGKKLTWSRGWIKEKWKGEFTNRGPISTGPPSLQGEKGKQIASTVLLMKSHFSFSHPLYSSQDPLFTEWSPSPIISNLTIQWLKRPITSFPCHSPFPSPMVTPRSTTRPPYSLPPCLHFPASRSGLWRWGQKTSCVGYGIICP